MNYPVVWSPDIWRVPLLTRGQNGSLWVHDLLIYWWERCGLTKEDKWHEISRIDKIWTSSFLKLKVRISSIFLHSFKVANPLLVSLSKLSRNILLIKLQAKVCQVSLHHSKKRNQIWRYLAFYNSCCQWAIFQPSAWKVPSAFGHWTQSLPNPCLFDRIKDFAHCLYVLTIWLRSWSLGICSILVQIIIVSFNKSR